MMETSGKSCRLRLRLYIPSMSPILSCCAPPNASEFMPFKLLDSSSSLDSPIELVLVVVELGRLHWLTSRDPEVTANVPSR